MPSQPLLQPVPVGILGSDQLGRRQAQCAHNRQRERQKENGLRELKCINKPQQHQHRQEKAHKAQNPQAGHLTDIEQSVHIDPYQVFEIGLGLTALPARAQHEVKWHSQHPMAGRRPDNRKHDPEPEVRERAHVDKFK